MSDGSLADGSVDEQRVVRAAAIGLPLVTVLSAGVVGVVVGPALSILVLAAGMLLGVIGLLWSSVRILSGDAPLSPELEALDVPVHGVDALASRKKMLLRALKDLEAEHAIGKIEDEDFQQLSATYRDDLKAVLQRIDESLAPHRAKAEELARAHLTTLGLEVGAATSEPAAKTSRNDVQPALARTECPKCHASNEPDAKFCKECATKLGSTSSSEVAHDA